jgi:hypothetical protein
VAEEIIIKFIPPFNCSITGNMETAPMKARDILRQVTPGGRILGILLFILGLIMILASLAANSDAMSIGQSNDPALIREFNDLAHQRDLYAILGVSSFFLSAFSLVVMAESSINPISSGAEMISQARLSSQFTAGLSLQGNAVFIPGKGALKSERMMIPASRSHIRLPNAITDDLIISPGNDGSTPGAILVPLGANLLDLCEKEAKRDFSGIGLSGLEDELQSLKSGFGLMKDFHIKESDGEIILRVEYSVLKEACRAVRNDLPDTCRQISCFGCSCILAGISKATGQNISVISVDNAHERVVFQLKTV